MVYFSIMIEVTLVDGPRDGHVIELEHPIYELKIPKPPKFDYRKPDPGVATIICNDFYSYRIVLMHPLTYFSQSSRYFGMYESIPEHLYTRTLFERELI